MTDRIYYGIFNNWIDVTSQCTDLYVIPKGDIYRAMIFGDPISGVLKSIFVVNGNDIKTYTDQDEVILNDLDIKIYTDQDLIYFKKKLADIHSNLKFDHGSLLEEYPEQLMTVMFLRPEDLVLEIGGNFGRNSLVIASILKNNLASKMVVFESDPVIANVLKYNRNINNFDFNIESCALSEKNLIQKGWMTMISDEILDDWKKIETMTFDTLKNKYNINFNVLIADCEGALYYILKDNPSILDNMRCIIIENDFSNFNHKLFLDKLFKEKKFIRVYNYAGGWGPCYDRFYEVFERNQ